MKKLLLSAVMMLLVVAQGFAQIELGECVQEERSDKGKAQINKALKAINQKNLKMANIYANNGLEVLR